MEAVIIIGHDINLCEYDFKNKYVIGVDNGAYIAYKEGIHLDLAVGDFDSISIDEYELICKYTKTIKLNPIKDETDTLYALKLCDDYDIITILGGIQGKRIEHFIANILLMKKDKRIRIIDNNSMMFIIDSDYQIKKNKYKYLSLFSVKDTYGLSLKGFKYNLNKYNLLIDDPLCISNEIIENNAYISFEKGLLLIILSALDK